MYECPFEYKFVFIAYYPLFVYMICVREYMCTRVYEYLWMSSYIWVFVYIMFA